jgi:hypothetical protein
MTSPLPPLYARWMGDLLNEPLPEERRSDCGNCPMVRERATSCAHDAVFLTDGKCCTYLPDLPNYLVGMILRDDSAEMVAGREQFERGALRRMELGPLGVYKSRERALIQKLSAGAFGTDLGQLCPYFVNERGGLCAIWKYRNSRCATWFCLYDRGAYGAGLWDAVLELLKRLELALAEWNLELIRPSWQNVWGDWAGREREFYLECAKRVEALSWPQALAVGGADAAQLAQNVRTVYGIYHGREVPERLRRGNLRVELIDGQRCRVWGYSPFDSIDLERALLDALVLFEGLPARDAIARIERARGIRLDDALMRRLLDYWILVPL